MTGTKPWAIGIVVTCTIFTSIGSLLLKTGADRFSWSIAGALHAYPVIIGLFFYFLGFVLLTLAFRHGELSVLFPFVSLSFVGVVILAFVFLKEKIVLMEMLGFAAIVSGVVLIGISSRNGRRLRLRG
jgi:multidrug transporter EmrE-like cation transporter